MKRPNCFWHRCSSATLNILSHDFSNVHHFSFEYKLLAAKTVPGIKRKEAKYTIFNLIISTKSDTMIQQLVREFFISPYTQQAQSNAIHRSR